MSHAAFIICGSKYHLKRRIPLITYYLLLITYLVVSENIKNIKQGLPADVTLVAVSKTYPPSAIMEAYDAGQRIFGENKVQEMAEKYEVLPKDIQWHQIGHLQTNKVKYIAPFVSLIHSIDSFKLLKEVNKQAQKNNRVIDCLLQIYIATEETKFGLSAEEATALLDSSELKTLKNVKIIGLMGMASNSNDEERVGSEFHSLKSLFDSLGGAFPELKVLSMGMSGDYQLAIREGSTMVRVGSLIFGKRVPQS
jgi:pyridoxal phosphate enzyme (YggS family)